jgi:hypothetical protein
MGGLNKMLYRQIFKTLDGATKRAAFERAHAKDGERGNVNFRFFVVRCIDGKPDHQAFNRATVYNYRIEKTLADHSTDPRLL